MLVALVVDLRNLVGERRFVYLDSILEFSRAKKHGFTKNAQ